MFCLIKKSWPVLNFKDVIPFLSLLYPISFRLYPFLFSLSSEQKPKKQTHAVLSSIAAKEDRRLRFAVVVSYLHQEANPTPSSSPLTPKKIHQKTKPKPSSSPRKSQTHAVLISIDAKEDPRLGFTVVVSHLHRQHSKIEPEIELLLPSTHHSKIQVRISLSPCLSMGFCVKIEHFLLHSDVSTCLCFLFFVFFPCFSSPIGKTHFSSSLFAVERIVDLQSKYTCHTASKCRRVSSKSVAVVNLFWFTTQSISIFLNTLFGCRESVGRLNKKKKNLTNPILYILIICCGFPKGFTATKLNLILLAVWNLRVFWVWFLS